MESCVPGRYQTLRTIPEFECRSEEHTSELQSLSTISYYFFFF